MDTSLRLLVIDDDRVDRMSLIRSLKHSDVDLLVDEADTMETALSCLEQREYDCILLDFNLPQTNAIELLETTRALGLTETPIIIVSGHYEDNRVRRCLQNGAQDYLIKDELDTPQIMRAIRYAQERKVIERALVTSQEQIRSVIDSSYDAFISIDEKNRIIDWNPSATELFGWSHEEALTKQWNDLFLNDVNHTLSSNVVTHPSHEQSASHGRHIELKGMRRNGMQFPLEMSFWKESLTNNVRHAFIRDVTLRKKAEEQLIHISQHDVLTGLANRLLFMGSAEKALARAHRNCERLAILFLDLDHFKEVNDTLGHNSGDELLKKVAQRLTNVVRTGDLVGRLGGDEFGILIEGIQDPHDAAVVAQQIIEAMTPSIHLNGGEVFVTTSIGIATYPDAHHSASELIKCADTAMYLAKDDGRNVYRFYSQKLHLELQQQTTIKNELHLALQKNELEVYYQPQIDADTNKIVGLEALLRWNHPTKGLITPGTFIQAAEHSGLIKQIGQWVLHQACKHYMKWKEMEGLEDIDLKLSINLSLIQLRQENLLHSFLWVIRKTGMDPKLVELEVTESALIDDISKCLKPLNALKEVGFTLSIDDFGTGYASFRHLNILPVQTLKIDQSFIMDIHESQRQTTIVKSMIAMARELGLKVIAEGVETKQTLEFLNEIQCNIMQGYYFSRPIPFYEVTKLLLTHHYDYPINQSLTNRI